ncbi:bifunctional diguanylate cyclase/phosphodiesterase [Wenzhouxiangella marina]|uniref:cyclic-guanylate-specific phosphodiesterase n=1 Tax=Wenzhouxiangella marina TaxID=1579979 RepID=A0A0K0XUJ1_9GAMM|nr:EAL domain-containing protein [Wenzhouxiangella marina]AKS41353.1 Sensory box/GGDEF family protein [Wenzhouxiangella marina]MBB6086896.1 diguanylate cyclase (GGDEF)-like protein/PAS domain S-box-containing protein [Wenzhouxiangella marina]
MSDLSPPREPGQGRSSLLRSERGALLTALALAAVGIALTAWVTAWLVDVETRRQQGVLARQADQAAAIISTRFAQYETLIGSAHALFASSEWVTREEWRQFSETILGQQDFAGLAGLGWIARLRPQDLAALRERVAADGLSFARLDRGNGDWVCPIVYNEPLDRNRDSIGVDVCRVDNMTDTLRLARERSSVVVSRRLDLVSPDRVRTPGYVMVAWVSGLPAGLFDNGGWVSASISAQALFSIPLPARDRIELEIHDLAESEASPVFRLGDSFEQGTGTLIEQAVRFQAANKRWELVLREPRSLGAAPWIALSSGLVGTALTAFVLFLLLCNRLRAESLAERMREAYRDSEALLSSITNNIFEGIYRGTPEEGLVYVNRSLARMFRFDRPEQMIRDAGPLLYADPGQREDLLRMLEEDGFYNDMEVEFIRNDGSRFTAVNNAVAVTDEHGRIRYFDGVIYDITARKQAEHEVHRLAHYDALTGLPNRTLFNEHLSSSLAQAQRSGEELAVLFLDLDHFKTINDSLGHDTGDRLLAQVASRLREQLRQGDMVCRQGGDEFLILLNHAGESSATHGAQRVLDMMAQPFHIDHHDLRISSSIGIALFPGDATTAAELIRNADAAMYLAKDKGRSNFQFFTPDLNAQAHERLLLERDLREALSNKQFQLHFQPQVDLAEHKVVGFEALLRWRHPERGQVPPDQFIPIAEQSGLIVDIGDWVIDEACGQLAEWQSGPLAGLAVSVNVSPLQLWRGTLSNVLASALERHGLSAGLLTIELTESALMHDAEHAAALIDEFSRLGIRVEIDDFGTGYSSLAYLKRFNISGLKIDRSFVSDLATDDDDAAIVAAVISMANDLKLGVIAEGVDSPEQVRMLLAHGCHLAQGYLFSPARPPEELPDWFSAFARAEH